MDVQSALELRRRKGEAMQDMDRANTRATDAVMNLRRAVVLFENPLQIDLAAIEAAVADIREAQAAYLRARDRRDECRRALGE